MVIINFNNEFVVLWYFLKWCSSLEKLSASSRVLIGKNQSHSEPYPGLFPHLCPLGDPDLCQSAADLILIQFFRLHYLTSAISACGNSLISPSLFLSSLFFFFSPARYLSFKLVKYICISTFLSVNNKLGPFYVDAGYDMYSFSIASLCSFSWFDSVWSYQ